MINKLYLSRLETSGSIETDLIKDYAENKESIEKHMVALCIYFRLPTLVTSGPAESTMLLDPILNFLLELDIISSKKGNEIKALFQEGDEPVTHLELFTKYKLAQVTTPSNRLYTSINTYDTYNINRFYHGVIEPIMNELGYPNYSLRGE